MDVGGAAVSALTGGKGACTSGARSRGGSQTRPSSLTTSVWCPGGAGMRRTRRGVRCVGNGLDRVDLDQRPAELDVAADQIPQFLEGEALPAVLREDLVDAPLVVIGSPCAPSSSIKFERGRISEGG